MRSAYHPARGSGSGAVAAVGLASMLAFAPALCERSYPPDCLPDRLLVWAAADPAPDARFGATWLPGVVLGPPGDSDPLQGSFSVASLGHGGSVTLEFTDIVIEDRPGPDLIVFENAFFKPPLPASEADDFTLFAEPGIVEVSADGLSWHAFPFDAQALAQVPNLPDGSIDKALARQLGGLAGITPTLTGNWTVPDDPLAFDFAGSGGVSGAGGDAFDLAHVGLAEARFVRITDAEAGAGLAGNAEGFDLDAVVALHGRPVSPAGPDRDGDLLSDAEELQVFGTNPDNDDTDGDGVADGLEAAACRDPAVAATDAVFHGQLRLWLIGSACTEMRWTFGGSNLSYDLLRGDVFGLSNGGTGTDLGVTACLVDDALNVSWSCDADPLAAGAAFFYLVRIDGVPEYGRDSALDWRGGATACP